MADVVPLRVIYFRYSECKSSYTVHYIDFTCERSELFIVIDMNLGNFAIFNFFFNLF